MTREVQTLMPLPPETPATLITTGAIVARRFRIYDVPTGHALLPLLMGVTRVINLPADAFVHRMSYDVTVDGWVMVVASEAFEPVLTSTPIPRFALLFEPVEPK